jgi:glutamate N-acetyltransferase/amino-acid N-acetyltransferase
MSITIPRGFRAAGVAAGLKASGDPDVAVVVNDGPLFNAAAVTTTNRVFAAPVAWTREVIADGRITAVVLNSGGANACTGREGFMDTLVTANTAAAALSVAGADHQIEGNDVAVCSTGLIGERLDVDALLRGVHAAAENLSTNGGPAAAEAIMTTDTVPKQVLAQRDGWSVGGMAKGAGMLAPGLATMLCVLTTDAVVDSDTADRALRQATSQTFDRVDSDGCMSTNDTVLLLVSGSSGTAVTESELFDAVAEACASLARQLIDDAEGSEHTIAVTVRGAYDQAAATAVARAVTRSNLFKTAIFGRDPNWGRIVSAVGTVPEAVAPFDPAMLDVDINGVEVCRGGEAGESRDLVDLSARDVAVVINLHAGDAEVTVWTNDLTIAYVHENSAYST